MHWIYFCYRPQRSCGQGNIFAPVYHSVHRGGGVCLSACWDTTTPGADSPGADTPLEQTPPGSRHPPWSRQTPPRADTPPEADTPHPKQTPPRSRHPPGSRHPRADTPWEQTPPLASRLRDTVNERPVRILLECILVLLIVFLSSFSFTGDTLYQNSCFSFKNTHLPIKVNKLQTLAIAYRFRDFTWHLSLKFLPRKY